MFHNKLSDGDKILFTVLAGTVYIVGYGIFSIGQIIHTNMNPFILTTPDGNDLSISQQNIDAEQNPIQCHAAELVATDKCGPGLFNARAQQQIFTITDDVFKEASNCFFQKMQTSTNNLELSKAFKEHLDKHLDDYKEKYPKERMKQLANLVRHTKIEFKDENLQFNKPGGGYVSISRDHLFFGNKLKISFYSRHTYTKRHLEQAVNNLFRVYDVQLGPLPELAPNITLKGRIR